MRFVVLITFTIAFDMNIQSSETVRDSSFTKMEPVVREPRFLWCQKHVDNVPSNVMERSAKTFVFLIGFFTSVFTTTTTTTTTTATFDIESLHCQDYVCQFNGSELITKDTTITTFTLCLNTCIKTHGCQYITFTNFRNQPVCYILSSCTIDDPCSDVTHVSLDLSSAYNLLTIYQ